MASNTFMVFEKPDSNLVYVNNELINAISPKKDKTKNIYISNYGYINIKKFIKSIELPDYLVIDFPCDYFLSEIFEQTSYINTSYIYIIEDCIIEKKIKGWFSPKKYVPMTKIYGHLFGTSNFMINLDRLSEEDIIVNPNITTSIQSLLNQ